LETQKTSFSKNENISIDFTYFIYQV
jgi:hypothetical protein